MWTISIYFWGMEETHVLNKNLLDSNGAMFKVLCDIPAGINEYERRKLTCEHESMHALSPSHSVFYGVTFIIIHMSCRVHSFKIKSVSQIVYIEEPSLCLSFLHETLQYWTFTTNSQHSHQINWYYEGQNSRLLANMQTASHTDCYCILLKFQKLQSTLYLHEMFYFK